MPRDLLKSLDALAAAEGAGRERGAATRRSQENPRTDRLARGPGGSGRREATGETGGAQDREALAEVPEVLSALRASDAPRSAPGCSAQAEGISETGVAAEGWEAGQVNVGARSDRRARWVAVGLLSAFVSAGCVTVTESPSRAVKIADLMGDPAAFDGKLVTITGQVSAVELRDGTGQASPACLHPP
jgi:hypothetical protein